jgi:diguanylate cyclase (GGDEF)-like protein
MDRFREEIDELEAAFEADKREAQQRAAMISAGLSLLLFVVVATVGVLWWRRADRATRAVAERDRRYREAQAEFAQTMQLVASEAEANALLRRHLMRSVPGAEVTVLNRAADGGRLEARTPVADPALADALGDARPDACLAIRLARPHGEGADEAPLLTCEVCGASGGERRCSPLLVSGEVIGSVLATRAEPFDDDARRVLDDSTTTAAPVLANLRAVAMAEARATTDALTGLPNRRAFDETLTRMLAQARRAGAPLALVWIDLDRFKEINDRHGHERGDEVLAAAAATLQAAVRASDFVARAGGEELAVLAPDTDADGAAVLAEHLRAALEQLDLPGLDRPVTASFGVAAYPEAGVTAEILLRKADRALYAAKEGGRNRVEVATAAATPAEAPAP